MQRRLSLSRLALSVAVVVPLAILTACPDPTPSSQADGGGAGDGGAASPDGGHVSPDAGHPDGGSPDGGSPDGGSPDGGSPDGGSPDGGEPDGGTPLPGPAVGELERLGLFLPAAPSAILPSLTTDRVVFGYRGVPVDPAVFGLEGNAVIIPTGIVVLDRASGRARLYGEADGVPMWGYPDLSGEPLGPAPSPAFDLTWIEDGVRFAGAMWNHLVVGTFADGELTFASVTLQAPGATEPALVGSVTALGGRLYVATNQGVAVVDPDTLAVQSWPDLGLGVARPLAYWIRAGSLGAEPAVAVNAGVTDDGVASHVVILSPGDGQGAVTAEPIGLASGEHPISLLALEAQFLFGVQTASRGEIRAVVPGPSGPQAQLWATGEDISASSGHALVPWRLAWDAGRQRVLVGGRLLDAFGNGGGLAQIPVTDGLAAGPAARLLDRRDPYNFLLPTQVDAIALDGTGDLYLAGRQLCNDVHLRQLAPVRVEEQGGELRMARPWISGVRSIAVDPVDGHTWLGTRDELPGMACHGPKVQQSLCRLRADGACEIYTPVPNTGDAQILPTPGVVDIAFGDATRREMALATMRDALFLRAGGNSLVYSTQIDPGLSLYMTSAAFGEPGELWLGSEMHYELYPQPEFDEEAINRRGPHGLGFLELDETARVSVSRRYVRDLSDFRDRDEVPGLPSDWVWDVLPLEGSRKALVATGWERMSRAYDHILPEISPREIRGGLAVVDDRQVTVVTSAKEFGDVVKLARGADGTVWGLDAEAGVFVIDLPNATAYEHIPAHWAAPERGLSLAIDESGRIAVGTTRGLYLYGVDGGRTDVLTGSEAGYVWELRFLGDGVLYAGTDQGLFRIAVEDATLPARGPEAFPTREIWDLDWGCWGELDCECGWDNDCAPGLSCLCEQGRCSCQDPDAPVDAGPRPDAGAGDAGAVDGGPADAGAVDGGPADAGPGDAGDPPACAQDCSCDTLSGCPDGWACQGGFAGFSCVEEPPPPPACAQDCSCDTLSGCPDGMSCIGGFAGFTCG